ALIVSADRWFLDRGATAILAFEGDGTVTLYEGSYTFYAERRPQRAGKAKPAAKAVPRAKSVAPRKLTFNETRELAGIEDAIAKAESRVRELEVAIADPVVFSDWAKAQEVTADLEGA